MSKDIEPQLEVLSQNKYFEYVVVLRPCCLGLCLSDAWLLTGTAPTTSLQASWITTLLTRPTLASIACSSTSKASGILGTSSASPRVASPILFACTSPRTLHCWCHA